MSIRDAKVFKFSDSRGHLFTWSLAMKLIKRITTTLSSNMNSAVNQLENHDSIIAASIKKTRLSIAKTQSQHNSLIRQQDALKTQLQEAQKQAALWTDRAARSAEDDKEKALACVAKRNHFEQEQTRIKSTLQQHQGLLREVTKHLDVLKKRLSETQQRHQLMRSRHSLAKTSKCVVNCLEEDDLDETFERWETLVLENDPNIYLQQANDELEVELRQEEDLTLLEAQLTEILEQPKEKDDESQ